MGPKVAMRGPPGCILVRAEPWHGTHLAGRHLKGRDYEATAWLLNLGMPLWPCDPEQVTRTMGQEPSPFGLRDGRVAAPITGDFCR